MKNFADFVLLGIMVPVARTVPPKSTITDQEIINVDGAGQPIRDPDAVIALIRITKSRKGNLDSPFFINDLVYPEMA